MRLREKYQLKNIEVGKIAAEEAPVDEELVDSLAELNQLDPIQVTPIEGTDTYKLIDGRRRLLSSIELGYPTVTAIIVQDVDDLELHLRALVANAGKPNPMDEALHMQSLKEMGWTHERIAKALRYDKSRIDWTLHLLKLTPEWQLLVKRGAKKRSDEVKQGIHFSTGYVISRLPEDQQKILYAEWEAGKKINEKYALEFIRAYQASLVGNFGEDAPKKEKVAPGLFLTPEQMAQLVAGETIEVNYQGSILMLKTNTAL